MTTLAELKEQYPPRETIQRIMGERLRSQRLDYDLYLCPFHEDRSASFVVHDTYCKCYAGCDINGSEWGSVLDFVKEYYSLRTWAEVERELTGKFPEPPKRVTYAPKKPKKPVSWADVEQGVAHQQDAIAYFQGRGLKSTSIVHRKLGKVMSWPHTVRIANEDHTFRCQRYSIPDIAFGRVRNIELRMDEDDARRTLAAVDRSLVEALVKELQCEPTEAELLKHLFGGKYTRFPGGVKANLIFNAERVMRRIEHQGQPGWFSPDMPYVLLHEGGLKALVMEDACDDEFYYPSIAGKGAAGIAACVGVQNLIIVQDNDADKVKPDGTKHNPGKAYAYKALELSGRRLGHGVQIIRPPDGLKDADAVVKAGLVHEWMSSLGIEPVRRSA